MVDGVVSKFKIELDAGETPIFSGGEVIRGKLIVELRKKIVLNAIRLQLKGRAASINDPSKADVEKVYFDQDFTLLERPPGKPEPGHFTWIDNFSYSLPFECPLPKGCPTSYEGPHAFIRYFIRATLQHEEEDGRVHEYFVKKPFCILSPSEGHLIVGEPATVQDSVAYGKCCCKGKWSAELFLPKTGYYPGDNVIGTLKINSFPKNLLKHIDARLVDRVVRVSGSEKSQVSPYRTLVVNNLAFDHVTKGPLHKDGVLLVTVPPVVATTKKDSEPLNGLSQISPGSFQSKLLESPSTATLRFRKQAFLCVEYAIQVSIGDKAILEIPIEIGELPTREAHLQPFVAGPQSTDESDEGGFVAIGGPFTYTPMYPVRKAVAVPEPLPITEHVVLETAPSEDEHSEKTPLLLQTTHRHHELRHEPLPEVTEPAEPAESTSPELPEGVTTVELYEETTEEVPVVQSESDHYTVVENEETYIHHDEQGHLVSTTTKTVTVTEDDGHGHTTERVIEESTTTNDSEQEIIDELKEIVKEAKETIQELKDEELREKSLEQEAHLENGSENNAEVHEVKDEE